MQWRRLVSVAVLLGCAGRGAEAPDPLRDGPEPPPPSSPPPAPDSGLDELGVRRLYPSLPSGLSWVARWGEGPRRFGGLDPLDPWFDATHGQASYEVTGDGTLLITGRVPRMYVRDPALVREWRDVEISVYFQRVADGDVPWGGMVSVARTNHGTTGDENVDTCDTRGIAARLRYDGRADFEKETAHPSSAAAGTRVLWPDGMPFGAWIGYKHVVYDLPGGRVRQELWVDETEAQAGGDFRLVGAHEDDGTSFGRGGAPCREDVPPELPLLGRGPREGSESGKPNIAVYFRSDEVRAGGLIYKWASVREIEAPVADAGASGS